MSTFFKVEEKNFDKGSQAGVNPKSGFASILQKLQEKSNHEIIPETNSSEQTNNTLDRRPQR